MNEAWDRFCADVGDALYCGPMATEEESEGEEWIDEEEESEWEEWIDEEEETCESEEEE